MGSPPPAGSKNEVLIFRSVKSIVMAPASTGSERSRRIAVNTTDQTNSGVRSQDMPGVRMLSDVVMKLIAPRILDTPARCSLKIVRSTDGPEWEMLEDSGG